MNLSFSRFSLDKMSGTQKDERIRLFPYCYHSQAGRLVEQYPAWVISERR